MLSRQLRDAGFDEDDSWDIGAIAALFALSNRMAFLTGMWPNTEFYAMGRQPLSAPLSTKGATGVQGGKTKLAEPAKKMGKRKKGATAKGRGKKTTA